MKNLLISKPYDNGPSKQTPQFLETVNRLRGVFKQLGRVYSVKSVQWSSVMGQAGRTHASDNIFSETFLVLLAVSIRIS